MDKIAFALSACDDNGKAIENLRARAAVTVADGNASDGYTDFGNVCADVALVRFDGNAATLEFGDKQVASGGSPLIAVLGGKSGALRLNAETSNARVVLFGGKRR